MYSRKEVKRLERHERRSLVIEEGDRYLLERIKGSNRRFIKSLSRNLFVP